MDKILAGAKSKILVFSVADAAYYKYLRGMVRSAAVNFPQANMFVELVNLDQSHADALQKLHPKISIRLEKRKFKTKFDQKCFCAGRRASLFVELYSKSAPAMWLDADSIIRRPCDELVSLLYNCDLTMRPKSAGRFASGTIGLGRAKVCLLLAKKYKTYVNADHTWMSDQNNLNRVYREFKKSIRFTPLPKTFCDVWLSEEGAIWAAKSKKKNSVRYLEELSKYL